MLGNFIHKYEEKIVSRLTNKKLVLFVFGGLGLSCVERFFVPLELFWGTVIATFCMFIFAIKNPEKKVISIMATIGDKYSMQIYISHVIVNDLLKYIKALVGLDNNAIFKVLNPIIIFAIIPTIIFVYENIWKKLKNKEDKIFERE